MAHRTGALPGGGKSIHGKMFSRLDFIYLFVLIRCLVKTHNIHLVLSFCNLGTRHGLANGVAEGSVFVEFNSFDFGHSLPNISM